MVNLCNIKYIFNDVLNGKEMMTVLAEYVMVATATLLIEHLVKYAIDVRRMKKKGSNQVPQRRLWDHKAKNSKKVKK